MAKFNLSGLLEVVFEDVEIEANSKEEALEKLYKLDAYDIIDQCYVKETNIKEEEVELVEAIIHVKAHHIEVEVSEDEVEETGKTEDEIRDEVYKQEVFLDVDICDDDDADDIEERINSYLEDKIGYYVQDFRFDVCPADEAIYNYIIGGER